MPASDMPKPHETQSRPMVTQDKLQAQGSCEESMAHIEPPVSEASEELVGGTERTTEMQHAEGDDVHMTLASSNSGTVRPAQEGAQTGTTRIPTPTPSSSKGKKATPIQPTQ